MSKGNELGQRIKDSNAQYENASPAEKRVIIMQDVIARVKMGQIIPNPQFYFVSQYSNPNDKVCDSVNSDSSNVECTACMKGGVALSAIARNLNCDIDFGDIENYTIGRLSLNDGKKDGISELDVFSDLQWDLIESAFMVGELNEEWDMLEDGYWDLRDYDYGGDNDLEDIQDAINFGKKFFLDSERMIAIAENVIENKGTFKP